MKPTQAAQSPIQIVTKTLLANNSVTVPARTFSPTSGSGGRLYGWHSEAIGGKRVAAVRRREEETNVKMNNGRKKEKKDGAGRDLEISTHGSETNFGEMKSRRRKL